MTATQTLEMVYCRILNARVVKNGPLNIVWLFILPVYCSLPLRQKARVSMGGVHQTFGMFLSMGYAPLIDGTASTHAATCE